MHEQKIDFQIQTTDGCSFVHSWQLFLTQYTDEKISHENTNKKLISKYKQPMAVHSWQLFLLPLRQLLMGSEYY